MAANPYLLGWRAEDEHYADENFADPDQKLVTGDNSPLNRVSFVWCDPAVASAPSWPQSANSACLTKRNQRTGLVPFKTITLVDDEHGSTVRQS